MVTGLFTSVGMSSGSCYANLARDVAHSQVDPGSATDMPLHFEFERSVGVKCTFLPSGVSS